MPTYKREFRKDFNKFIRALCRAYSSATTIMNAYKSKRQVPIIYIVGAEIFDNLLLDIEAGRCDLARPALDVIESAHRHYGEALREMLGIEFIERMWHDEKERNVLWLCKDSFFRSEVEALLAKNLSGSKRYVPIEDKR